MSLLGLETKDIRELEMTSGPSPVTNPGVSSTGWRPTPISDQHRCLVGKPVMVPPDSSDPFFVSRTSEVSVSTDIVRCQWYTSQRVRKGETREVGDKKQFEPGRRVCGVGDRLVKVIVS